MLNAPPFMHPSKDFFLVMAILAWLVLGLVAKSATGNSALLDAW